MSRDGPQALSRARLSIGAKLTLRYSVAVAVTLGGVALFVYTDVTRRINREAELLLDVEVGALADEISARAPEGRWDAEALRMVAERFERLVRTSAPSLRVGVALVEADGARRVARGSLAELSTPVPASVLRGERESALRAANLGESYAFLAMAHAVPGGAVQMVVSTERYADNIEQVRDAFLLAFPVVILLTAVVGFALSDLTLRPVRQITESARRISTANLAERVPLSGSGDELDRLAETLNDMLARIDDGLAKMRRFNANAAHELRTPLSALSSQIEVMLERERSPEEYRQVLEEARGRVSELAGIIDAMLRLARSEAGLAPEDKIRVEMRPVLENVYEFFQPVAAEKSIALDVDPIPDATVLGDPTWLHQLFANLVSNAIKFTPKGGSVRVSGQSDGRVLRICVRDSGAGLGVDDFERSFERFQRGLETARVAGFGLGLPIAREIARAHGGDIEIEPADVGSTFCVRLPVQEPSR